LGAGCTSRKGAGSLTMFRQYSRWMLLAVCVSFVGGCGSGPSGFERKLLARAKEENLSTVAFDSHLIGQSRYVILRGPDLKTVEAVAVDFLVDEGFKKNSAGQFVKRNAKVNLIDFDVLTGESMALDAPEEAKLKEPGIMLSFSP
jgi:hypothetical protein